MSSDNDMRAENPQMQPRGQGHMSLFLCGECNGAKPLMGRRLRFVRKVGMRVYVCAKCNEALLKARAE